MKLLVALLIAAVAPLTPADQISAASGVMHRLLGRRADAFHFSLDSRTDHQDFFRLGATRGVVEIVGSSGTALTRGAYTYLKDACHCVVTWDGNQVALPPTLPDFPTTEVVCPNQYRLYYNVCTFGYSLAFWNWHDWEREIDWMALHGINMPLAMTGQEKVWESVWMNYGLTDLQALAYMTGPAFLPWHWMGNLDSHGGPMPQDYVDRSADLQKRILERERDLGMTPVVPGFSGFVPNEFQDIYPRARVMNSSGWAGFPPTHQLDARDPMFASVQARFIKAYTKLYGTDHLYLCDLYNEMKPTVSPDRRLQDLNETGRAIIDSVLSADPQGKWVMQGWLFHNDPTFWKEPEISALLSGVPDERMILLDLAGDQAEIWRQSAAFRAKPHIWNLLHGFGGATPLFGDLDLVATRPIAALGSPEHGNMVGMGLTMEGINQNAAVYELMCDTMWRTSSLDPAAWMRSYVAARYHVSEEVAAPVADAIRSAFYTKNEAGAGGPKYQNRPGSKTVTAASDSVDTFRHVVELMLDLPAAAQEMPLYRRDLVDVTKRYVAELLDGRIVDCVSASRSHDQAKITSARTRFDSLMLELDALLDTIPQYRLANWISAARHSSGDGDLLEKNARLQVTVWGGPILEDYAAKEWSGLVGDFYRPRWDRFFDALDKPGYSDEAFQRSSADWELAWCSKTSLPKIPRRDAIQLVRELVAESG